MEKIIKGKKFMIREYITGREEDVCGIVRHLMRLRFIQQEGDQMEGMEVFLTDKNFNDSLLKLASFMVIDPKMTTEQLLDLPSASVQQLKLLCFETYAKTVEEGLSGEHSKPIVKEGTIDGEAP